MTKSWRWPLLLSGFILISQAFPLPSPVRDTATGAWVNGYSLQLPPMYLVFAPFCGLADRLTLLSYHQIVVFMGFLICGLFFIAGVRRGAACLLPFIGFIAWTILVPHPMVRLVASDPDILLIDFHSHTQVSHDGRSSFSAEANMRWHRDQGYGASFITDHNRIESSEKAKAISRADWRKTGYRSLEGEEVSLLKTHLVVLGVHERIDNQPWDSDAAKIPMFIAEMKRERHPVIASLPEYWWYHWPKAGSPTPSPFRRGRNAKKYPLPLGEGGPPQAVGEASLGTINDFVRWGISGFEIINSAPKALDFPPSFRLQIVFLCHLNNLYMTGISDNHGYGYATAAWNAMRIPGWRLMDPDQLETMVLKILRKKGFEAVEVLERARYNPETSFGILVSPLNDAGLYWRSLSPWEAFSWVLWIWIAYGLSAFVISRGR